MPKVKLCTMSTAFADFRSRIRRHTDTIYKVNHLNGSIVWRLGGRKSDFEFDTKDAKFSRQHHATVRGQNETHAFISMFDNAIGTGSKHEHATHKNSRGLLLALRTGAAPGKMSAGIVAQYAHPHGGMTNSRGSYQALPNGNAFLGWTYNTLLSEHTADGRLIMEARLKLPGNCYRSYKFPWIGRPAQLPDVLSTALVGGTGDKTVRTVAYVSWNGATEVASWNLHKTDQSGNVTELIASMSRQGFETALVYDSYASHVVVEALDRHGEALGKSAVVVTIPPRDRFSKPVVEDVQWLQDQASTHVASTDAASPATSGFSNPTVAFLCGAVASLAVAVVLSAAWRLRHNALCWWHRGKETEYEPLWPEHSEEKGAEVDVS